MSISDSKPLLVMRRITKVYPDGVKALEGVDFEVARGEVHALLGENGAGKSTLMRILFGEIQPTGGEILFEGVRVRWRGPWDALSRGIAMVYQNVRLVPGLKVRENLRLFLSSLGLSTSNLDERVSRIAEDLGFKIDLDAMVDELPMGARQRVDIVKSLLAGAKLIILDEPTSNLTPMEAMQLSATVKRLKSMGVSVVYITHRLEEVEELADRVTILRRGVKVGVFRPPFNRERLASLMVGEIDLKPRGRRSKPGARRVLSISRLTVVVEGVERVKEASLDVYEGEILGLAGVAGNGQEELVKSVLGILKPASGNIEVLGRSIHRTKDFYKLGGGYIPGERSEALALDMSVAENAAFIYFNQSGKTILLPSDMVRLYRELVGGFGLVAAGPWTQAGRLSGGNQQKLVVGSEALRRPKLLVAVNPTQGLDVATTRFVRNLIASMADEGTGVLLVSSDLEEVLELSDRIAVMSRGKITGVISRGEASMETIGVLMGG